MSVLSNFSDAELRKWADAYGVEHSAKDSRDSLLSKLVRAPTLFANFTVSFFVYRLAKSIVILLLDCLSLTCIKRNNFFTLHFCFCSNFFFLKSIGVLCAALLC
jgi:hypothetical protein